MIIEALDLLKAWLAKQLEPICDADPTALAKYVIALVKKDKPEPDLKALCEDQLDVFLGQETKPFVTSLFHALVNKTYMPAPKLETSTDGADSEQKGKKRKSFEEAEKSEVDKVVKTDNKTDVGKIVELEKTSTSSKNNVDSHSSDRTKKISNNAIDNSENSNEIVNEKPKNENKGEIVEPNKDLIMERKDLDDVSMRGVSQDRSMKSMSPALPRSSKHGHSSRRRSSRSPNRSSRHSRSSRRSRREHRDRSRERRGTRRREKEKCRDYEEKGICMLGEVCPYDHGYDPVEVDDRNLPQMLSLAGIASTQAPTQPVAPPLQIYPNVLSAAPRPPIMAPVTGALTLNTGLTTVQVQKPRPIPSPVEHPGGQVPIFRPRNPIAFMRNISPPVTPAPLPAGGVITPAGLVAPTAAVAPPAPSIVGQVSGVVGATPVAKVPTAATVSSTAKLVARDSSTGEPYNPEEPSIEVDEVDKAKKGELKETKTVTIDGEDNRSQNELVQIAMGNVPLTPIVGSQPSAFPFSSTVTTQQNPPPNLPPMRPPVLPGQYMPDILQQTHYLPMSMASQQYHQQVQLQQQTYLNSLQQQQQLPEQQQQSVVQVPTQLPFRKNVLEIRKIPAHFNTIAKLSEHFQKFGTITKIQTPLENDAQGALIEFSSAAEANKAYSSPEPIFSNRFIKVFWYNPNRNQNNGSSGAKGKQSATQKDSSSVEVKPKKVANAEELKYVNPNADTVQGKLEKKKEIEKLKAELAKKKQTSYDELIKKQKGILSKLEDKDLSKEEKQRLLKAFKACDVAVQKLKKEIMEDTLKAKSKNSPMKSFRDPKKEILDREMDIFHGNLQGEELAEARKSLEELKREMYTPRGRGYRGRGRGRASWYRGRSRGRGRGGYTSGTTVDNRPKQILVSGYEPSEKDAIVSHFTAFGQLDRIEETAVDKMVLTFPSRKAAEIAAIQGAEFNGKTLVLAWFTGHLKSSLGSDGPQIQRRVTRSLSQSLMEKDLDDELLELDKEEEEMLLAGVDDDDDDDENSSETNERSWRR